MCSTHCRFSSCTYLWLFSRFAFHQHIGEIRANFPISKQDWLLQSRTVFPFSLNFESWQTMSQLKSKHWNRLSGLS
jgi:hypothetical protein